MIEQSECLNWFIAKNRSNRFVKVKLD